MIVHIGYHKTGTTFLQKNVFPKIRGLKYYNYETCAKYFKPLVSQTTLEFDAKPFIEQLDNSEKALYSYEALVGKMGIGTYNVEIAQRLADIGFKKIVVSIKNQGQMLESIYRQYIQQGGVLKPNDFFEEKYSLFRWSYLDYHSLIAQYVKLFGKENVLVFLQEELKTNQTVVIKQLCDFLEVEQIKEVPTLTTNRSLSSTSIKLLRIINHFTFNHYRPSNLLSNKITTWKFRNVLQSKIDPVIFSKLFKNKPFVPKRIAVQIEERCGEGNRELQREFGLNLEKFGDV